MEACGCFETAPMIQKGMKISNQTQVLDTMTIYASEFFHPFDYMSGRMQITQNTFSIHHFNGGWSNEDFMEQRMRTQGKFEAVMERMEESNA